MMKKLKLMPLALVMFFVNLSFDVNAQTASVVENAAPKIVFEKLEHDYGKITEGADGEVIFSFSNTGKEPLILTKVHGCCGVSVLDWSKEPVAPDAMGFIKLRYYTARIGGINKVITVNTNDPDNQLIHLRLKGEVQKKAEE